MSAPLTDAELVAEVKRCPDTVRELLLATRLAAALEQVAAAPADSAWTPSPKAWSTIRARAARHGTGVFRTDVDDGPLVFFAVTGANVVRALPDMAALERLLDAADAAEAARAGAEPGP